MAYEYIAVLRARQQEIDVLENFEFSPNMIPLVEIIKEKARTNQKNDGHEDYGETFNKVKADKIIIDLPIYLDPTLSTANEVRRFYFSTISNLKERVEYYLKFTTYSNKVIPAISILQPHSDEADSLIVQFESLKNAFPQIAIRIYIDKFEEAYNETANLEIRENDIVIYDLDTTEITNPLVKIQRLKLEEKFKDNLRVVVRSAINTEIQNVKLQHGSIIPEANNSLLELYRTYKFSAFGDYSGVKKDDITSGGTISPGFIFFNPEENLYYGFKGATKSLSEFETRIVPDVLASSFVRKWIEDSSPFIIGNLGFDRLVSIFNKKESGKSQAKFKWIAIMHYLHCIKVLIDNKSI